MTWIKNVKNVHYIYGTKHSWSSFVVNVAHCSHALPNAVPLRNFWCSFGCNTGRIHLILLRFYFRRHPELATSGWFSRQSLRSVGTNRLLVPPMGALKTREWTTRHEMTRVDKAGVDKAGVETRDRLIWQKVTTVCRSAIRMAMRIFSWNRPLLSAYVAVISFMCALILFESTIFLCLMTADRWLFCNTIHHNESLLW